MAFAVLPLTAARFGVLPVLVAVPAMLLELVMVVLLSRVVAAGLAATMSSRRGQELGGLLMAVVIALASGGWSLATVMGQQLAAGASPALGTALRVLPSGWGAVAVAAADRSDWPVALAALAGLAAALIVAMGAANLDGDDGTALWLTRMVPGTEAADVRGRQAAWLLVVAPVMLALTVTLTALSGPGRGWRPRSRRCWARPPAWGCCCR